VPAKPNRGRIVVEAVVNIEGAQAIVPTEVQIAAYRGIPVLELFGDHLDSPVFTGQARYEGRKAVESTSRTVARRRSCGFPRWG
jgi:hypothetical protein